MMPAHTIQNGAPRPSEAGDVPHSALGIGYDADVLERQAELEELAEAELDAPLPDEDAPAAETRPPAPRLGEKLLRTFAFAFTGAFLAALLPVADEVAGSGTIDLSPSGSLLVGATAAAMSAGIRALVALAPVLPDDDVGFRRVEGAV
jgi:hypothetical protein